MYSFIVITYNEQEKIKSVIDSIRAAAKDFEYEIVVSDGDSSDETITILKSESVKTVNSDCGRGIQFISGVNAAKGDVFIFLHGDTLFPEKGIHIIDEKFKKGIKAATFRTRFDNDKWLYKFYGWFTKFDSVFTSFGDQGIVVTKELYNQIGGFPDWQIFEDVELLTKIRKKTKIESLPAYVITSARRYEANGIIKQQIINFLMILGFYFGLKHTQLKKIYDNEWLKKADQAIILLSKYPEEGKVKARLAESIGAERATQFYRICCDKCFKAVKRIGGIDKFLFINESKNKEKTRDWVGDEFKIKFKKGESLGDEMFNSFQTIFQKKYKKIVILGTDIPDLSTDIVIKAFVELEKKDIVIGPSKNGGYYLIGMNEPLKDIFKNINWSSSEVLSQTIDIIKEMNLTYKLLEELMNIDYYQDLIDWSEQNKNKNHPVEKWMKAVDLNIR